MENKTFGERVEEAQNILAICDQETFENEQFSKHQLESMLRGEQMTQSLALQVCDRVITKLKNKALINNHSKNPRRTGLNFTDADGYEHGKSRIDAGKEMVEPMDKRIAETRQQLPEGYPAAQEIK